jgi:O-antigen/teichoic acid export membrane protein
MQVLAWGGFAVIHLTRQLACTALMARLQFRALFAMTVASAAISLALVVALIGPFGATGAIVGMTTGELLLAVLAWRVLLDPREGQARSAPRIEAQSTAC